MGGDSARFISINYVDYMLKRSCPSHSILVIIYKHHFIEIMNCSYIIEKRHFVVFVVVADILPESTLCGHRFSQSELQKVGCIQQKI